MCVSLRNDVQTWPDSASHFTSTAVWRYKLMVVGNGQTFADTRVAAGAMVTVKLREVDNTNESDFGFASVTIESSTRVVNRQLVKVADLDAVNPMHDD